MITTNDTNRAAVIIEHQNINDYIERRGWDVTDQEFDEYLQEQMNTHKLLTNRLKQ